MSPESVARSLPDKKSFLDPFKNTSRVVQISVSSSKLITVGSSNSAIRSPNRSHPYIWHAYPTVIPFPTVLIVCSPFP